MENLANSVICLPYYEIIYKQSLLSLKVKKKINVYITVNLDLITKPYKQFFYN